MIMTAVSEKDAVICIHDDYCIDIEAAEISQILLKFCPYSSIIKMLS